MSDSEKLLGLADIMQTGETLRECATWQDLRRIAAEIEAENAKLKRPIRCAVCHNMDRFDFVDNLP